MLKQFEIRARIKEIKDELDGRYKYGTVKLAKNGIAIPVKELQDELYKLTYKLSKMLSEE